MAKPTTNSVAASWLDEMEIKVQQKFGTLSIEGKWTEFVKEVVGWLHYSKGRGDADIVATAKGLVAYGVSSLEDLQQIADDKKAFREELKAEGVLPAICNGLFDEYVAPRNDLRRQLTPLTPIHGRSTTEIPPSAGVADRRDSRAQVERMRPPSKEPLEGEVMDRVNRSAMRCSANSTAMAVVGLLFEAETSSAQERQKFLDAAQHIHRARQMGFEEHHHDAFRNERFFTGAFCEACNGVLDQGLAMSHQACLGSGTTHSDVSARYSLDDYQTPVLLVGEGKANTESNISDGVCGQLFNELVRHRNIDTEISKKRSNAMVDGDNRPILLVSFNYHWVVFELAFPSTKGGRMEKAGWVEFRAQDEGKETFWTIEVARINIRDRNKLAIALHFLSSTLKFLFEIENTPREQGKTPWLENSDKAEQVETVSRMGENISVAQFTDGNKKVYKEFCYYLREPDGINDIPEQIEKCDQRQPPDNRLLTALTLDSEEQGPYTGWTVSTGPYDSIKILSYDYINGETWPRNVDCWITLLKRIKKLHDDDLVHGDLLPRNVLFSSNYGGIVLDFDLSRKEGEKYVKGYTNRGLSPYRHKDAVAGGEMKKEHDTASLVAMTNDYISATPSVDMSAITQVDRLIELLTDPSYAFNVKDKPTTFDDEWGTGASGSPKRYQ